MQKGSHVKVVGRLQQDRWQDKEGHHHSKIKIISEYFEKQQQQSHNNREQHANRSHARRSKTCKSAIIICRF